MVTDIRHFVELLKVIDVEVVPEILVILQRQEPVNILPLGPREETQSLPPVVPLFSLLVQKTKVLLLSEPVSSPQSKGLRRDHQTLLRDLTYYIFHPVDFLESAVLLGRSDQSRQVRRVHEGRLWS